MVTDLCILTSPSPLSKFTLILLIFAYLFDYENMDIDEPTLLLFILPFPAIMFFNY